MNVPYLYEREEAHGAQPELHAVPRAHHEVPRHGDEREQGHVRVARHLVSECGSC